MHPSLPNSHSPQHLPAHPLTIHMLAPFGIRPKGTLAVRMLPLAQALHRQGHHVQIIAPAVHNPQDAGRSDEYDGVTVVHTAAPCASSVVQAGIGSARTVWELLSLTTTPHPGNPHGPQRPDIIHLFKPKGYSGLAVRLLQALQKVPFSRHQPPIVVDTDDWEGWGGWNDLLPYPHLAKQLFAWQEYDLPRRAHAVTVASRTLQAQIWGFGVNPERVFYLPNGVSPNSALPSDTPDPSSQPSPANQPKNSPHNDPNDCPTILLYTRFWEFDVVDLIPALIVLVQRIPDVRILVIGKGERGEEQLLLQLAERAGIRSAIDYRGWVDAAAIPTFLASADVALAPMNDTLINRSRCSVKLLEMMDAGLPIVAANVGQVAEYLEDGQSGLLVPAGDMAALARAAVMLVYDVPLRRRLGRGGQERARTLFSWDRIATVAAQVYDYCLAPKRASATKATKVTKGRA